MSYEIGPGLLAFMLEFGVSKDELDAAMERLAKHMPVDRWPAHALLLAVLFMRQEPK